MRKKYLALGILLIAIIAIAIPISYFVAEWVVYDASMHIGFTGSGSMHTELAYVTFSGIFNFTNYADISMTVDYANITVHVFEDDIPYNGDMQFIGSVVFPHPYLIGSAVVENELLPAKAQFRFPVSIDVTSQDALNIIQSGNYSVRWNYWDIRFQALACSGILRNKCLSCEFCTET